MKKMKNIKVFVKLELVCVINNIHKNINNFFFAGFTEDDLQTHSKVLEEHVINGPKLYYRFDSNIEPDVWFEPIHVWEVKCADLSLSPAHKAAIGIIDHEKGISLRFPRFIRVREDKTVESATTSQQVADMYSSQDQIKNRRSVSGGTSIDDDFY